ncbi:MAG: hypothetical protein ABDH66_00190 [Bacteroidia bacterium]
MAKINSLCLSFSLLWAQHVGIGVSTPSARLHVRGSTSDATSHALRVDNNAGTPIFAVRNDRRVGIGTLSPAAALHVMGNVQFSGTFRPAGNPGSAGHWLVSQGANNPPTWQNYEARWILWAIDSWDSNNNTTQGWTGAAVTACGAQTMLGGYNQCGAGCVLEKTYTSLPPHSEVMVEVYYWAVDSWDQANNIGVDHVRMDIDDVPVAYALPGQVATSNLSLVGSNNSICGTASFVDRGPFLLIGHKNHTATTLNVKIRSGVNQASTDESLGITAVYIWIKI